MDINIVSQFTITEVFDKLGIEYAVDFPDSGGVEITIYEQKIYQ